METLFCIVFGAVLVVGGICLLIFILACCIVALCYIAAVIIEIFNPEYEEVYRCKKCGEMYYNREPQDDKFVCRKCGAQLGKKWHYGLLDGYMELSDNCESLIAKHTLTGWKVKEEEK